jgi:D-glycerate 3-kinase
MRYHAPMSKQCIPSAAAWLTKHSGLELHQRQLMSELCPLLIGSLPVVNPGQRPATLCIGGAPGSGKSTLARMLAAVLSDTGHPCQLLSLDDYYLTRRERQELASQIHPLCSVRGVPGSHDLELLLKHLQQLKHDDCTELHVPRFDKATDDRMPDTVRCKVLFPLEYIVVEGWVCGAPPQHEDELAQAVNSLEAEHDSKQEWRYWVNQNLAHYDREFGRILDQRWYMKVPDWNSVVNWRTQQEQELNMAALKTAGEIKHFLAHYQRLVQHMQSSCESWADLIIKLDVSHCASI